MNPARYINSEPGDVMSPVYRKIDRLHETMNAINDIASDANRSIRQGRFEELAGHHSRAEQIARKISDNS